MCPARRPDWFRFQWNSNAGDLFSPRPAFLMGISPPSGQAGDEARTPDWAAPCKPAGGACCDIATAADDKAISATRLFDYVHMD